MEVSGRWEEWTSLWGWHLNNNLRRWWGKYPAIWELWHRGKIKYKGPGVGSLPIMFKEQQICQCGWGRTHKGESSRKCPHVGLTKEDSKSSHRFDYLGVLIAYWVNKCSNHRSLWLSKDVRSILPGAMWCPCPGIFVNDESGFQQPNPLICVGSRVSVHSPKSDAGRSTLIINIKS